MAHKVAIIVCLCWMSGFLYGMDTDERMPKNVDRSYITSPTGYPFKDTKLTLLGPHFFENPQDIDTVEAVRECAITFDSAEHLVIAKLCDHLVNLKILRICNMPIKQIRFSTKTPHKALETLEVSHTAITDFSLNDMLASFPNLKHLSVRHNFVENLTYADGFYSQLEDIDLSDNKLTTIDFNKLLTGSLKITTINLSDNPLQQVNWVPDDFIAHYQVPEIIMVRTMLNEQKRNILVQNAADDNFVYLWMKKFVPAVFIIGWLSGLHIGFGGCSKRTVLVKSLGVPFSYLIARLLVDTILFPKPEEKRIPYFTLSFDEN